MTVPPSAGAVVIQDGKRQVVLTAGQLARLPQRTSTVTFIAGTTSQTDTETGPALSAVLLAAHVLPGLSTWVAAVGDDGYVATVTPAEALVGDRPLLSPWPRTAPRCPSPGWSPTATSRAAGTSPGSTT